jgi:hypothetical protein
MTEPTNNQAPFVTDSMETLPLRMLDAFRTTPATSVWCLTNKRSITSPDRMREVLLLVANEVEAWATSYTTGWWDLAVMEVAKRLRAEADQ